jgi:predicted DNA-binding transcriptional regulator AlpA
VIDIMNIAERLATVEDGTEATQCTPRRMLNEAQILQLIPVSRSTLFRMIKQHRFPRGTFISPNRRVWLADEVAAWQDAVDEHDPNRGRGKGRRPRAST